MEAVLHALLQHASAPSLVLELQVPKGARYRNDVAHASIRNPPTRCLHASDL